MEHRLVLGKAALRTYNLSTVGQREPYPQHVVLAEVGEAHEHRVGALSEPYEALFVVLRLHVREVLLRSIHTQKVLTAIAPHGNLESRVLLCNNYSGTY